MEAMSAKLAELVIQQQPPQPQQQQPSSQQQNETAAPEEDDQPDPWAEARLSADQGQTSNDNNWNNRGWNRGWRNSDWNDNDSNWNDNDSNWNQGWWKRNDDERDRPYLSHLVFPAFDGKRQEYSTYKYDVMNLKSQCSAKDHKFLAPWLISHF